MKSFDILFFREYQFRTETEESASVAGTLSLASPVALLIGSKVAQLGELQDEVEVGNRGTSIIFNQVRRLTVRSLQFLDDLPSSAIFDGRSDYPSSEWTMRLSSPIN